MTNELEEKVLELRRIIQDKEFTIQQLEKKLKIPDKDTLTYKIKEVEAFPPTPPNHDDARKILSNSWERIQPALAGGESASLQKAMPPPLLLKDS